MTTVHLINHTHWDREWYRTFQQFRLRLVNLVDHLLDILDNDPLYLSFLLDGQTILLEDYLEIHPEREPDLVRHIKNGRLFIGPWYISPDEFLISPESHIRNLLEGDRLCNRFGGKMAVGYLPDTFGHIGQMPQILIGFSIKTACLWRGLDDEPCELIWKAPDGSKVLLAYLRDSYSNAAGLATTDIDRFTNQINELTLSLSPYSATGQVLLMHGTDHMEPPSGLTSAISAYADHSPQNHLIISNLPQYFASVQSQITSSDNLPVVTGELRSSKHSALLPNVLSTRIHLKQRNTACETRLLKWVEPLNAWSRLLINADTSAMTKTVLRESEASHDAVIRYAWKLLMQCHPHDSICGTSIDQVVDEMLVRFDQVDQISAGLEDQLINEVTTCIDTRFASLRAQGVNNTNYLSTIVVFNPHDHLQTGLIKLGYQLDANYSSFDLIDGDGISIPFEQTGKGSHELISMKLNKKAMKQAFGMIHEGNVAGLVIREFEIVKQGHQGEIRAILSDHGSVDVQELNRGIREMEVILADPEVDDYIIHAYSDPETEISFLARDVPQHGYCCYWIRGIISDKNEPVKPVTLNPLVQSLLPLLSRLTQSPAFTRWFGPKKRNPSHSEQRIENEYFNVAARPGAEGLSVYDKRTNTIFEGLNKIVDGADCGDLYNYCPPVNDRILTAKIQRIDSETSTTCQKITIEYDFKIPSRLSDGRKSRSNEDIRNPVRSIISLIPGIPRIDIRTEIENLSFDHRVRVHFPAPFETDSSKHDGHFEIVERKIGIPEYDDSWEEPPRPEVPQGCFSSIASDRLSLTVANRGLPEVEIIKGDQSTEISVTLLRCVGWLSRDDITTRKGHAGPMDMATPDAQMIGKHAFDYSIIPGDGLWNNSIRHAYAFSAQLQAVTTHLHTGNLPPKYSLLENLNPNFMISAVKTPQTGPGVIVRGFNLLPDPIEVTLKLPNLVKNAQMVNLDETPIHPLEILPDGNIHFTANGNQIVTVHFTP